jgi:hypothetical protein
MLIEELHVVAVWMKSIRQVTPLAEGRARELRHIAYSGASELR